MAIDAIGKSALGSAAGVARAAAQPAAAGSSQSDDTGFGEALRQLLSSVDEAAGSANTAVANMMNGTGDVHDAMIALHRAETTLQLTVQLRNKLVNAYQDVMRMPI